MSYNTFIIIFMSLNAVSFAFPTLPLSISSTSVNGNPLISDASLTGSSFLSTDGNSFLPNNDLIIGSSSSQMIYPKELIVPEGMVGPAMMVQMSESTPEVTGFSSRLAKVGSALSKPFKKLFKTKDEDFIIVEEEEPKFKIDEKFEKVVSEFKSAGIAAGKATLNKVVSKVIESTDNKMKGKYSKINKPNPSLEATIK